jgi:hypothetical protein
MILAAGYLLWMFQRIVFGEISEFFKSLGHHLTDMTPAEVLTVAPLAALIVVLGLFPGLVLDLVHGSVTAVLADAAREGSIALPTQTAVVLIALPILYVVGRLIWVARIDLSGGAGGGSAVEPVASTEGAS